MPTPETPNPHTEAVGYTWIWAACASLLLFAWAHHSAFFNQFVINDDTRQQLFWMQRWREPGLYPPDLLNEYARAYVPWGVQGLYYLASFVVDPLTFSKILTGVLYVFTGTLIHLSGRQVGGDKLGMTAVAVYWFVPFFLHAMSGGLARAFAGPLLMLFLYGWLRESRRLMAAAVLLQSLFIPYIFLLCGAASACGWFAWKLHIAKRPPFPTRIGDFLLAALACALLLVWKGQMSDVFGPLTSFADMAGRPEFSAQGRFLIIPVPSILHELFVRPWEFIAPFRDQNDIAGIVGLIVIIPLVIYGGLSADWGQWRRHLYPIVCLAFASVALYTVGRILLLKLFLPSRYLEYSVNIGYCFLLGSCLHGLLFKKSLPYGKATVCIVLVLLVGCYRNTNIGLYDYSAEKALYQTVQKEVPKDALIAGPPSLMDNVLTFGKRNVFASYELAHPWNMRYWERLRPRLEALFDAYYAGNLDAVATFCRENAIDYIVVDKRHFTDKFLNGHPFFAPFDERLRKAAARTDTYALLSPQACSVRIDDNIHLVDARSLTRFQR